MRAPRLTPSCFAERFATKNPVIHRPCPPLHQPPTTAAPSSPIPSGRHPHPCPHSALAKKEMKLRLKAIKARPPPEELAREAAREAAEQAAKQAAIRQQLDERRRAVALMSSHMHHAYLRRVRTPQFRCAAVQYVECRCAECQCAGCLRP